ncbi:4230_t:CDS:2 [Funneliformis caledonium]|uniref:4230_t:CDS:1 n=1 Tax=Funneliformis caledonium TaxID=1117310 RepID=A0A9N9GKZ8_9GLOM|nr:4230_t:CDS:2 [Funneliformis caledonium]
MAGKRFSSIKEELEHYKARTAALEATLLETQSGMEEFQATSRELEEDLERELEQSEKRYKELKSKNEALKNEVDEWKQKYYQSKSESNVNQTQMQRELDSLRSLQEKFVIKTRELEIDYDDLERTERAAKSSLIDLENKYNKAIERNVILENELEGKNLLIVQVQRLKDDLRDVNIELAILKNKQDGEYGPPPPSSEPVSSPPRKEFYNPPPQPKPTIITNSQKADAMNTQVNSIDPNSNPVKMVQEMVGRVKSLEARLVSCRSLVTPLLAPPPSYSTTMPLASNSPPPSPKARMDSSYRNPLKSYRRSSLQKSKAFSMTVNQMRSKVQ